MGQQETRLSEVKNSLEFKEKQTQGGSSFSLFITFNVSFNNRSNTLDGQTTKNTSSSSFSSSQPLRHQHYPTPSFSLFLCVVFSLSIFLLERSKQYKTLWVLSVVFSVSSHSLSLLSCWYQALL